eukprot:scaffold79375_cov75-Phaeocystis_antarctica.AAC.4
MARTIAAYVRTCGSSEALKRASSSRGACSGVCGAFSASHKKNGASGAGRRACARMRRSASAAKSSVA